MTEPMGDEEWRPVEGWPYEVSNLGRVRRKKWAWLSDAAQEVGS